MSEFDRVEEARERNAELHYTEYHESREYLRQEDEENDHWRPENDEPDPDRFEE